MMVSYLRIVGWLAIVGIVSAHAVNKPKTVRLGKDGIEVHEMKAPSDWDRKILEKMVYEDKSGGLDASIVNGELVTSPTQYPSVVSLVQIEPISGAFASFCTGAMIDSNLVLTAAHCVQDLDTFTFRWAVCGGIVDLNSGGGNCALFETWWWPTAYDNDQFWLGHDLSVIKVDATLVVDPIKIIKVSLTKPQAGKAAVAVGFGITSPDQEATDGLMRKTDVNIVLNEGQCKFLSDQGLGWHPKLICSDGFSDGAPSGTCQGDSGSPLLVPGATTDDQYTVGALSFGPEGCSPSQVGVYASMYDAEHIAFLREAVQEAGGTFVEANPGAPTPPPTAVPTSVGPTPAPTAPPTPTPTTPSTGPTPAPTTSSTTPTPSTGPTPSPTTPAPTTPSTGPTPAPTTSSTTPTPSTGPTPAPTTSSTTPTPSTGPTPSPTPSQCPPCPTASPPTTVLRVSEERVAACTALGDISCLEATDPITSTCCAEATAVLECWIPVLKEVAPDQVASSQAVLTQLHELCV